MSEEKIASMREFEEEVFKSALNLKTNEEKIKEAITTVCSIDLKDDVTFQIVSIGPIRKDDKYGGYCVRLNALYDTMITALSIDVSTGDVITPSPIKYEFSGIFDEELKINLWGYNIETVLNFIGNRHDSCFNRYINTCNLRSFIK